MKRVYIAGPMSGIPKFNIPLFDEAAVHLREMGLTVFSPAEIDGEEARTKLMASEHGDHADLLEGESWSFYLSRDFRILVDERIDTVVTLPGWKDSRGARLEMLLARELGIAHQEYADIVTADSEAGVYDSEGGFVRYEDNPLRQRSVHGGVKDNRGKSRVDLLPMDTLIEIGKVLEYGARKYKPNNWRLGLNWSDTMASLLRHLFAFQEGQDLDPETGFPHLAHAGCQVLFLLEYYLTKTGTDDRWATSEAAKTEAAKA